MSLIYIPSQFFHTQSEDDSYSYYVYSSTAIPIITTINNTLGFIVLCGLTVFFLFWIFHVLHMFGSLAFPFKFQQWSKSKRLRRQTYLVELILIFLCGVLPWIILTIVSDYQFPGFPYLCLPSSGPVLFYTFLLPVTILSTFGLCLLFASFWILHKVSNEIYVYMCTTVLQKGKLLQCNLAIMTLGNKNMHTFFCPEVSLSL